MFKKLEIRKLGFDSKLEIKNYKFQNFKNF